LTPEHRIPLYPGGRRGVDQDIEVGDELCIGCSVDSGEVERVINYSSTGNEIRLKSKALYGLGNEK
jgi:hypothetical protein